MRINSQPVIIQLQPKVSYPIPPRRSAPPISPLVFVIIALVALIIAIVFIVRSCSSGEGAEQPEQSFATVEDVQPRVSFLAVGDNVPNDVIAAYADKRSGAEGDDAYDYHDLFAPVKPYVEAADLAYIDQEVHVGGAELGARGYPSFNTTDEMADAVVDTGFDLVASATNHAYDWGPYGAVEHSRSVWNALPVAFTGTATSEEEAANIPVVERNGMKFALLSYTYGLNGYERGEIPEYYVNYYDEQRLTEDVAKARGAADVVIVAMHWGEENNSTPTAEETQYAQLLADLGVDVVVGSHPHIIQPMTWLQGKGGNKTLVCYSLGNFIMQYEEAAPYSNLEGMMACDFVKSEDGNSVSIENVKWIPLVYHGEADNYAVWPVKDYSSELASKNLSYSDKSNAIEWLREESDKIVNSLGDSFEIDA